MSRDKGLIGVLGQGIGMAAEYREHRRRQKASSAEPLGGASADEAPPTSLDQVPTHTNDPGQDTTLVEDDEQDWQLDEAGSGDNPPSYEESENNNWTNDDLVREVVNTSSGQAIAQPTFTRRPLPCPVVIPQRRPGSKSRGFVRAYAPLLGECTGIDQDTFLAFIKTFHQSSQASPVFRVIQISAFAAGLAPSMIAQIVSASVGAAAEVGAELNARARTNNVLDKMNEELFIPAGVYAMIVRYTSDTEMAAASSSPLARFGFSSSIVDLNTTQAIAKRTDDNSGGSNSRKFTSRFTNLSVASGTTNAITFPEAAPLIFPDIDAKIAREGPETFKDKAKDFKKFLDGYRDRRAQGNYARDNPDSPLVVPEGHRSSGSGLSDPDHPMYRGGLIGFVSGGKLDPKRLGGPQRAPPSGSLGNIVQGVLSGPSSRSGDGREAAAQAPFPRNPRDLVGRPGNTPKGSAGRGGPTGLVKKVIQEGVLYLMIVNMPSEAELAQAKNQSI